MPRKVRLVLDAFFCIVVTFSIAREWFRQACQEDARSHLFGMTIITHADYQVVVRDWSNQLRFFSFAQKIDLSALQSAFAVYIAIWIIWRLCFLAGKPRKIPRGFEVIQKPSDLPGRGPIR